MDGQVSSLEGVGGRDPSQVAKGQHEAESIHYDVHSREDRGLVQDGVEDIVALEQHDDPHRDADMPLKLLLLHSGAEVEEKPQKQARAQLVEVLQVQLIEKDARVQLPSDEEIIQWDLAVASLCEQLGLGRGAVGRLERPPIQPKGHQRAEDNGRGDNLGIVVIQPGNRDAVGLVVVPGSESC